MKKRNQYLYKSIQYRVYKIKQKIVKNVFAKEMLMLS